MLQQASNIAQDNTFLMMVNPAEWETFALDVIKNAPAVLADAYQVLKTQTQKNKLALILGGLAVAGVGAGGALVPVAPKLKFDGGKVGNAASMKPSTTQSSCDPSATANEDSVSSCPPYVVSFPLLTKKAPL